MCMCAVEMQVRESCACVKLHYVCVHALSCVPHPSLLPSSGPQGLLRLNLLDAVECALKSDER